MDATMGRMISTQMVTMIVVLWFVTVAVLFSALIRTPDADADFESWDNGKVTKMEG